MYKYTILDLSEKMTSLITSTLMAKFPPEFINKIKVEKVSDEKSVSKNIYHVLPKKRGARTTFHSLDMNKGDEITIPRLLPDKYTAKVLNDENQVQGYRNGEKFGGSVAISGFVKNAIEKENKTPKGTINGYEYCEFNGERLSKRRSRLEKKGEVML